MLEVMFGKSPKNKVVIANPPKRTEGYQGSTLPEDVEFASIVQEKADKKK